MSQMPIDKKAITIQKDFLHNFIFILVYALKTTLKYFYCVH